MKKNSGITMMSLVVYVGVFLIVIGIISSISSVFYKNAVNIDAESTSDYEYNKFNLYLLEETKKNENYIAKIANTENEKYIEFSSGVRFEYKEDKIYYIVNEISKIVLCNSVEDVEFILNDINEKDVLHVDIVLKSLNQVKQEGSKFTTSSYSTDYVVNKKI